MQKSLGRHSGESRSPKRLENHRFRVALRLPGMVSIQSRVVWDKLGFGPGVRAVRAGSIGRDGPGFADPTGSPQGEAGGLGPRPLHEEISAL